MLWIPYFALAVVVLVLSVVFYFAEVPDVKGEDDYHLTDATPGVSHSIWTHPHFVLAVVAQFLYVAAQAGIFSFFINYMVSETPAVPGAWQTGGHAGWFEIHQHGALTGLLGISDKGAANLASVAAFCFLSGRFIGSWLLKKFAAHTTLGVFSTLTVLLCVVVVLKLGWVSAVSVFLIYFFMSIMFPTIFALGIFGLGERAKSASSFIVMAIIGGAILPKLMGKIADSYNLSVGFLMPMACFACIAAYAFLWPRLSQSEGVRGMAISGGH